MGWQFQLTKDVERDEHARFTTATLFMLKDSALVCFTFLVDINKKGAE